MLQKTGAGTPSVADIPPAFTSQTCSKCGHQSSTNRDSETGWFECNECGYSAGGDYTAYDNSSSDRESTDKPTTSVVGR